MRHRFWEGLLVLAIALTGQQAVAAHEAADVSTFTFGANPQVTFTASAQLASPIHNHTYVVPNPNFTSHADHQVSIDGPANETFNVDYSMKIYYEQLNVAELTANNQNATTNAMGHWEIQANLGYSSQLTNGVKTAKAASWIKFNGAEGLQTSIHHDHSFTVNVP